MALLKWDDRYSVGIAAVDYEHKELIEIINRLHDELSAGESRLTSTGFFGDLLRAISAHFALEEKFMRDKGYDQLVQHKTDHERLLDEIRDIMDDFEDNQEIGAAQLSSRLDAWFSRHFETHDARLHKTLGHHPH